MGRRGYPPEFRRKVVDLVEAGRSVADVARDLGISEQTVYTWRRQDRIDRRLLPGLTSAEKAELAAAKRRVAELEAELAIQRRASAAACGRSHADGSPDCFPDVVAGKHAGDVGCDRGCEDPTCGDQAYGQPVLPAAWIECIFVAEACDG